MYTEFYVYIYTMCITHAKMLQESQPQHTHKTVILLINSYWQIF